MSYGPLLVKHGDSCARERHQLIGYQVNEHVRHRAVERLESEPSQVARTGADATEGHLGHALCREACDEAVAQVASAVDVDVAHREEVEVLRGSLHRVAYCRLSSCICDSRRLSSCLAAPMGHVLPREFLHLDHADPRRDSRDHVKNRKQPQVFAPRARRFPPRVARAC